MNFPDGVVAKNPPANAGDERDVGLIPGFRRSPGGGKGYSLQFYGLENSMDCTVHGVRKSWTQLSNFHFLSRRFLEAGIFSLKTATVLGKLTLRGS